jgi:hypothetical protein
MRKKDKNLPDADIDEERLPVTKIIVKDLMRGTYREGHAKQINWNAKPKLEIKAVEKKPEKKNKAIIISASALAAACIVVAAVYIKTALQKEQPKKIAAVQEESRPDVVQEIRPDVIQTLNDWNKTEPAPAKMHKQRSQRSQIETSNAAAFEIKNMPAKEKIYTWVENGVRSYTNLEDVARAKNAVELK